MNKMKFQKVLKITLLLPFDTNNSKASDFSLV